VIVAFNWPVGRGRESLAHNWHGNVKTKLYAVYCLETFLAWTVFSPITNNIRLSRIVLQSIFYWRLIRKLFIHVYSTFWKFESKNSQEYHHVVWNGVTSCPSQGKNNEVSEDLTCHITRITESLTKLNLFWHHHNNIDWLPLKIIQKVNLIVTWSHSKSTIPRLKTINI